MNTADLFNAVSSHAMATGLFESVNQHEPGSAPPPGLSCSVWLDSAVPVRSSGLDVTSAVIVFTVRLYSGADTSPRDGIDPALLSAVDTLCAAYIGDFVLNDAGGNDMVRAVDVHGSANTDTPGMSVRFGYVEQGGRVFRVATIVLPVIVNDVWTQGA